jgi:hypothetical protein
MMPIEPDHYGVLELAPGSPMEDVKSQYRRLAKRWHPDLHNNDVRSQEQFRRINAAYAFLSDAPRKAAYDACLEAARKIGAPPLRASPPSPTATGYHPSVTATGYHAQTPADVRMTRSAWLGATAGVVVVLLVIGLSLDSSGPSRPVTVESAPSALDRPPLGALGDGAAPEAGRAANPLAASSPPAAFAVPASRASQVHPHRLPPDVPSLLPNESAGRANVPSILRAGNAWTPSHAEKAAPADALKQRLLARYQAALPRADRLLGRGYAVHAASSDAGDGSRRILRDQLAADLAELNATRARVRPAIARLSQQSTPENLQQEAGPILADLRRLEDARQPVRDDLKALASPAFHFAPPAPVKTALLVPAAPVTRVAPVIPPPRVATVVEPEAPKPPDKTAAKPKAPASPGQEFIMWGR